MGLWGQRLHQLPAAQAVCQALLLRLLRHPLQGCEEQVARVEKGQNSAAEIWIPESSTAARSSPWRCSRWWTPWCSWSSWWTTKDVLNPPYRHLFITPFWGVSIFGRQRQCSNLNICAVSQK